MIVSTAMLGEMSVALIALFRLRFTVKLPAAMVLLSNGTKNELLIWKGEKLSTPETDV